MKCSRKYLKVMREMHSVKQIISLPVYLEWQGPIASTRLPRRCHLVANF